MGFLEAMDATMPVTPQRLLREGRIGILPMACVRPIYSWYAERPVRELLYDRESRRLICPACGLILDGLVDGAWHAVTHDDDFRPEDGWEPLRHDEDTHDEDTDDTVSLSEGSL